MRAGALRSLPALLLFVAIALAYAPGRHNTFVEWDDAEYIRDNPALTAPDGLRRIWSPAGQPQFYPLTFTVYWLQYRLWGPEPRGYFLVQVALHAVNALLVAALARRLGVSRAGAWLAAAVFALHPMQVASVAWLAELKNGLSGLLALAAALLYISGRQDTGQPRNGEPGARQPPVGAGGWHWDTRYALSLVLFAAALLSKTAVVALPVSLWAAERFVFQRRGRGPIVRAAIMLAPAAAAAIVTVLVEHDQPIEVGGAARPRVLAAAAALWFYVGKLLLPLRQPALYPAWNLDAQSLVWWLPLLGLMVTAVAALRWRRYLSGLTRWAVVHFLALVAPTLGLVPFGYLAFAPVADHFVYLALIGPCIAVAGAVSHWAARGAVARRGFVIALAGALVAGLALRSWQQVHVWSDAGTLWSHTLRYNPRSAVAHNNLGLYLERQGAWPAAQRHYAEAARLQPTYAEAQNNLGAALSHLGELDAALAACRRAIELQPQFAEAHNNLGTVLARLGRTEEAAVRFEHATRLKPSLASAHANHGAALLELGRLDDAIQACREALHRNEADAFAHLTVARALARRGEVEEAVRHYDQALRWRPEWPDAMLGLSWTLATWSAAGPAETARAVRLAESIAERLDHADPWVLDTLAAAYAAAERFDDAVRAAEQARRAAQAAGQAGLVQIIERRLALYRAGRPFHPRRSER